MLKDNHIWSSGSITNAVKKARSACGFSSKIEVECGSLEDAVEEKFERNFRVNREMRDEILVYYSILDQILSEILILGFKVLGFRA